MCALQQQLRACTSSTTEQHDASNTLEASVLHDAPRPANSLQQPSAIAPCSSRHTQPAVKQAAPIHGCFHSRQQLLLMFFNPTQEANIGKTWKPSISANSPLLIFPSTMHQLSAGSTKQCHLAVHYNVNVSMLC